MVNKMLKIDNDGELIHTYSDAGFKIRRNDGEIFEEAYDLQNSEYSYEETDEKVEAVEVEENAEGNTQDEAEKLLNILVYGNKGGE
jgi:hypothetical protein